MSAAKFTPAPWWVTESGIRDSGGYICFTNAATRYEGQDERYARETEERAANKLLIASAPELYEALQKAHDMLVSASHFVSPKNGLAQLLEAQEQARSALSKATGSAEGTTGGEGE